MKSRLTLIICGLLMLSAPSCRKHLMSLNENPNGANPDKTNPSFVLSTVLTETGKNYVNLGFQDLAGVMQHTQKDGWVGAHNEYDWGGSNSWTTWYDILRNNQLVLTKAQAAGFELHEGVALVMKAMLFGLLTDLYGDVPYSQALKGDQEGSGNAAPACDPSRQCTPASCKTSTAPINSCQSLKPNTPRPLIWQMSITAATRPNGVRWPTPSPCDIICASPKNCPPLPGRVSKRSWPPRNNTPDPQRRR